MKKRSKIIFIYFFIISIFVFYLMLPSSDCDVDLKVTGYIRKEKCANQFRRLAEMGDVGAMAAYAEYASVNDNYEEAYYWTEMGARNGSLVSLERSINYCAAGIKNFDSEQVERWIKKSIDLYKTKDDEGTGLLVRFYSGEYGCKTDLNLAFDAIREYKGRDCYPPMQFARKLLEERFSSSSPIKLEINLLEKCLSRGAIGVMNNYSIDDVDKVIDLLKSKIN